MNTPFSQIGRMGQLETVLGLDVMVLRRFTGSEQLNDLFDYSIECLAAVPDIDFDSLIGTAASVTLKTHEGSTQPFHGIITEARWLGAGANGHRYELRVQPWFFLASLRRNQRIFHNMTVVDILQELLSDYADAGALVVNLAQSYPELEYTVQYRESDMAFATRLMERHGISYHFKHREDAHDMVLTDMVDSHASIGMRPFKPAEGHHQQDVQHFYEWRPARRITTGAVRLTDYNFKTPKAAMEVDHTGDAAYMHGQIESFDWPGDHLDLGRGNTIAQLRAMGERGQDRRYEAVGDIVSMRAGALVTLGGDPVPGLDEEFLCLTALHSYESDNYGSGEAAGEEAYVGRYVLMPKDAPMLPEHKTPRADVKGPQTAKVVGSGEIDCDEYGRILVQFHWDLDAAYSMRCRVSQNWAGKGWGGMVIPRIGMEVVVEFLDGDPDKPLVTGCVYNGYNDVPYALPEHKTRSTFKTDTHQGSGYNELRFEDKNGKEEIFVHAQKDRNEKTLNNHSERIDNNWVQSVGANKSVEVKNNHVEAIGGNMSLTVGPSSISSVVAPAAAALSGGIGSVAFALAKSGLGEGNFTMMVDKSVMETVGLTSTESVGVSKSMTAGVAVDVTAGRNMSFSTGVQMTQNIGKMMNVDVGDELTITVGASRMVMKKDGSILITGDTIKLEAGKQIDLTAGSAIKLDASKINFN